MKAGDLVTLSAYGKSRQYNGRLRFWTIQGPPRPLPPPPIGLVLSVADRAMYGYEVKWVNRPDMPYTLSCHSRKELKHMR